jgi:predicted RNase H-like HicB family nuclease
MEGSDVMSRNEYTARAQRDGRWWAITVAGLPGAHTQVRRLDQALAMTREVIALVLKVPEDSFDVQVVADLTEPQRAAMDALDQAKASYAAAAEAMTRRQQDVAALLVKADGLTVRDAAVVLGVSFQRVSQLTSGLDAMVAHGEMREVG